MSGRSFDPDYALQIGERLRSLRLARGWSLTDAERISGGEFYGVTLGSWERGDRGTPVHKLAALAALYDVPVATLIPGAVVREPGRSPVLDEFPGELDLCRDSSGRWVLVLSGPELSGTAVSTSREMVLALAEAYAAMARAERAVSAA